MSSIFRALTLFALLTVGFAVTTSPAVAQTAAFPAPFVLPAPDPVPPGAVVMPNIFLPEPIEQVVSTQPMSLPTFNGEVRALVIRGSTLYVGGDFTHAIVAGKLVARSRLAAINIANGELLSWKPTADAKVNAIAVNELAVFIAGEFSTINGRQRDSLAAVDPVTGNIKSFSHRISGRPKALAITSQRLYLGGTVTGVDGVAVIGAAAFDLNTGRLDRGWAPKPRKAEVHAILVGPGGVYLGGGFARVGGAVGTSNLALVDPATGAVHPGFTPAIAYNVHGLALFGDRIYAAVAGPGGRIMSVDSASGVGEWTVTTDGDVVAVAVLNDVVYFGGHYDRVCVTSSTGSMGHCNDGSDIRIKIAAVNLGGKLLGWTANANGVEGVTALIADSELGVVAAGGTFTKIGGKPREKLVVFG